MLFLLVSTFLVSPTRSTQAVSRGYCVGTAVQAATETVPAEGVCHEAQKHLCFLHRFMTIKYAEATCQTAISVQSVYQALQTTQICLHPASTDIGRTWLNSCEQNPAVTDDARGQDETEAVEQINDNPGQKYTVLVYNNRICALQAQTVFYGHEIEEAALEAASCGADVFFNGETWGTKITATAVHFFQGLSGVACQNKEPTESVAFEADGQCTEYVSAAIRLAFKVFSGDDVDIPADSLPVPGQEPDVTSIHFPTTAPTSRPVAAPTSPGSVAAAKNEKNKDVLEPWAWALIAVGGVLALIGVGILAKGQSQKNQAQPNAEYSSEFDAATTMESS